MRPKTIGRTLGIGLRVAGRVAGERMAGAQAGRQAQAHQQVANNGATGQGNGQAARPSKANLGRGIGAFLRPFGKVGRAVWLEVMGVFFLLPVVIFARFVWRDRASWSHGPQHSEFIVSCVIVVIFLYLGITSFMRAWKK